MKTIKQIFCNHDFKQCELQPVPISPSLDLMCRDVKECSKCGLKKYGRIRHFTDEERGKMLRNLKEKLDN